MSAITLPTTERLERSLSTSLSARERLRLGTQLGSAMLAAGLLVVGVALRYAGPLENRPLAELLKAAASVVVSLPLFARAAKGVWTGDGQAASGQLVLLATIAAFSQGDFLTAALIPILMTIGHVFEERSILGAQAAIDGLKQLQARTTTILVGDRERDVPPDSLKPGDLLLVRPGERIAADGVIRLGTSTVDQSSVTGESRPEDLGLGCGVFAGTLNLKMGGRPVVPQLQPEELYGMSQPVNNAWVVTAAEFGAVARSGACLPREGSSVRSRHAGAPAGDRSCARSSSSS